MPSRAAELASTASTARATRALRCAPRAAVRSLRVGVQASIVVPPAWPGRALVPEHLAKRNGPKPISLIGSTGSIGTQTLDICAEFPDQYKIVALAAGSNITLLAQQACSRSVQPPPLARRRCMHYHR